MQYFGFLKQPKTYSCVVSGWFVNHFSALPEVMYWTWLVGCVIEQIWWIDEFVPLHLTYLHLYCTLVLCIGMSIHRLTSADWIDNQYLWGQQLKIAYLTNSLDGPNSFMDLSIIKGLWGTAYFGITIRFVWLLSCVITYQQVGKFS